MDEAALRIVLVDEGGQAAPSSSGSPLPSPPNPSPSGQKPFDPIEQARKQLEQEERRRQVEEARTQLLREQGKLQEEKPFDPIEQARKELEAAERRQQIEEARTQLLREQGKLQEEKPFDPIEEAKRLLEIEERRQQVAEARTQLLREQGKLQEGVEEQFDPFAEVARQEEAAERKRQVEAARRSQEQGISFDDALQGIRDEEAKAKQPPPPFDPADAARRQAESEARSRQVREAYVTNERPDQAFAQVAGAAGMGNVAKLAGSFGELSLAAGPVGAAVAGIQALGAASDLAAGLMNQATRGLNQLGTAAVQIAGNDYLGAFKTHIEGTSQALEQIPVVGGALGAAMRLATAPVVQFARVVEAFVDRGAELARFSADITAARAMAQVRGTSGDIREADKLGSGIASLTDSSSQILQDIRDIILPLKEVFVNNIAGVLEFLAEILNTFKPLAQGVSEIIGGVYLFLQEVTKTILQPILWTLRGIHKILKIVFFWVKDDREKESAMEAEGQIDDALKSLEGFYGKNPGTAQPDPGGILDVPVFQGAF